MPAVPKDSTPPPSSSSPSHPEPPAAQPLSCSDIAARIRAGARGACSVKAAWKAIQRLGLQPVMTTGGGLKFYDPRAVALIEADMRGANHRKEREQ